MRSSLTKREKKARKIKIISVIYAALVYIFLYTPIAIIILFSFNTSKRNIIFEGFTTHWYGVMLQNTALLESFRNTLIVAASSTIISIAIGTLTAVGMYRYKFRGKGVIDALLYIPVVIPEIVLGISLLSIFSVMQIPLGLLSIIIAHATFSIPYVVFTVRARLSGFDGSIEEAAMDLGANRFKVFFYITIPVIAPGIIAGGLLAFTLSVDDIIISFFTTGPSGTTFPLKAIELVRSGISPDVYALSTLIILCTFTIVTVSQIIAYKRQGQHQIKIMEKKNEF